VRWLSPEEGMVPPARFIPLAEQTGLIVPLGDWVLRTACAQAKHRLDGAWPELRVAVKLSGRQLRDPNLSERIAAILAETGLPPECLKPLQQLT
jgi:EAL domain-containing protein (putative c-di-GMP-specific phosphodiesterase class I)